MDAFDDEQPPPLGDDDAPQTSAAWRDALLVKPDGTPKTGYSNTLAFVRSHPEWAGRWSRNEMADAALLDGKPVSDGTAGDIIAGVERELLFTPRAEHVAMAIGQACDERRFHPVRDYLTGIAWDGERRLDLVASKILGAVSPLHSTMVLKFMVGAVARVLSPGCKHDTALVLTGPQGHFKSTFFATLARPWFCDSEMALGDKDSLLKLHATWIYEWAELELVSNHKSEVRVKAFLASASDTFRAPYARTTAQHERSCVIVGTTNEVQILTDQTGSRRFWVVPVGRKIDIKTLAEWRDQLWGEARAAYAAGEPWWLDDADDAQREDDAEQYQTRDTWQDVIAPWLEAEEHAAGKRHPPGRAAFTLAECMAGALQLEPGQQDKAAQMRAGKVLRALGYEKRVIRRRQAGATGPGSRAHTWGRIAEVVTDERGGGAAANVVSLPVQRQKVGP